MGNIVDNKWCVIIDGSCYLFFDNDKALQEYVDKHSCIEDHEIQIKAISF